MAERFDAVIVGSGFGGAVIAHRLAATGMKVLVLERGRRWERGDYPRGPDDRWFWDEDDPGEQNGWLDLRNFGDMIVAQGAAVGGGSLVYANIFVVAKPFVFETGWPPEITFDALARHYETVGEMLNVQELPDNQLTERFKLMREAAEADGVGDRFEKLPLAVAFDEAWHYGLENPHDERHSRSWRNDQGQTQGTCVHCGNCDIGCPVLAKNTLDLNYLAAAEQNHAEIRALHRVTAIRPVAGGYEVDFDRIDTEAGRVVPGGKAMGTRLVLAAGSLGSTELLLRARDETKVLPNVSGRLGHGWSSNGDFLTPALYAGRKVSPTRGPTITCAINFLDGVHNDKRFFVEDGGFPDVLGNAIRDISQTARKKGGMFGILLHRALQNLKVEDPLSHVMPWFGQAVDAADGRLHLGRDWWRPWSPTKLKLDWNVAASKGAVQAMVDMHKQFSRVTGGTPLEPFFWRWFKNLITPHPLGGCCMGTDRANGVVDHKGEVFGYPRLYVADSAIIPRAIGLNPSRTIAALAEHIAEKMIQEAHT